MSAVIPKSSGGRQQLDFSINGDVSAVLLEDGSLSLASEAGFGHVEAPWARDSLGRDIPTHFEVTPGMVTQYVDPPADAAYPIVADPTWAWWNFAYGAKLTKAETRDIANAGNAITACGILVRIPGGAALTPVCAALAGYLFAQANVAKGAGECIFVSVVPAPTVWRYKDKDCR